MHGDRKHPPDIGMTTTARDVFTIDELAQAAGMTPRNVRAYRTKGLLPPPFRQGRTSRYRLVHLHRLRQITHLREAGLPLKLIAGVLQRGGDAGSSSPLPVLTSTLTDLDVVQPAPDIADLMQRLAGHGLATTTVLTMLTHSAHAARTLAGQLSDLVQADLLHAHPDHLPGPVLTDTADLAVALIQQTLREQLTP